MNIEQSILERLTSDTAITAIVGDRIYPTVIPNDEPDLPWITYAVTDVSPRDDALTAPYQHADFQVSFAVVTDYKDYETLRDLTDAIRTRLHYWQGGQVYESKWTNTNLGLDDSAGNLQADMTFAIIGIEAAILPTSGGLPRVEVHADGLYFDGDKIGASSGTVTSVAVSGNNGVSVSGSPITSSGTITVGLGAITPTSVNTATVTTTDGLRVTQLQHDAVGTTSAHNFRILSGGTERIRVGSSGLVSIGSTPANIPIANLDIRATTGGTQVAQIVRGATGQSADLTLWQNSFGTNVAAVTSDGRMGIGTSPVSNSTLHIKMPGTKQGFIVTNGDSTGTQTWFGFTTGPGPLSTNNDEYVNFYKDPNGWIWNSDRSGTGTVRSVRWSFGASGWVMKLDTAKIGFFNAAPVAQQTGGAATATATYGTTEQDMLNKVYTAMRNYGLLS